MRKSLTIGSLTFREASGILVITTPHEQYALADEQIEQLRTFLNEISPSPLIVKSANRLPREKGDHHE